MASVPVCDNCGKPMVGDNPRMFKLYLSPIVEHRTRSQHSDYTKHMDIGRCCASKILSMGKWQGRKRQPQKARRTARA